MSSVASIVASKALTHITPFHVQTSMVAGVRSRQTLIDILTVVSIFHDHKTLVTPACIRSRVVEAVLRTAVLVSATLVNVVTRQLIQPKSVASSAGTFVGTPSVEANLIAVVLSCVTLIDIITFSIAARTEPLVTSTVCPTIIVDTNTRAVQ
jgi:hypothetical protein